VIGRLGKGQQSVRWGVFVRRAVIVVVALLVLVLGWLGFRSTQPVSFHKYRTTAVQTAEAARDAVRTAALTVSAMAQRKVTHPYVSVVLDTSVTTVAKAVGKFAELPPPDKRTTALRDELRPLLADTVRELGDVARALDEGDAATVAAAQGLGVLGDRLDGYLDAHG
jgi:hypothetical protein